MLQARQTRHLLKIHTRTWSRGFASLPSFDMETDVLVVGSGAGGLTAGLRAKAQGMEAIVAEKSKYVGGSSGYSGAGVWIPETSVSKEAGIQDSKEDALKYLEIAIGDVGPVSSKERKLAFLDEGPKMVDFLRDLGFDWLISKGCPDYYCLLPGGLKTYGRTIEPNIFDMNKLEDWKDLVIPRGSPIPPILTYEANYLPRMLTSIDDFAVAVKVGLRAMMLGLRGQSPVTMGQSLIGQLLLLAKQKQVDIWRETVFVDLITDDDGSVVGAKFDKDGKELNIRAKRGVLLGAGGFAHNQEMRDKYHPSSATAKWTNTPPVDTGDAIKAGMKIGAATALLDDAWWMPTMQDPNTGGNFPVLPERSRPYGIIVDSSGSRFMNESQSYTNAGQDQYARHEEVAAIPAWLIVDTKHRNRYMMATLMPRLEPKEGLKNGFIYKADTLEDLAKQIGVDDQGLQSTVERFNAMARKGKDEDFGRGESPYDNFYGDPKVTPNPNLGPLEVGPFYATRIFPGDIGTKGGLLTDEHARVVREDGSVIQGLYATGNTSASVMGRIYPGAGGTLGPAMTFAYIATDHMNQVEVEHEASIAEQAA